MSGWASKVLLWLLPLGLAIGLIMAQRGGGECGVGTLTMADGVRTSFSATTLDGEKISVPDDFGGKVVLVDFWATWCPPCRAEIPHLVETYGKLREKGLEIVGVSLDEPRGIKVDKVRQFLKEQQVAWPNVYANAVAIANQFGVEAIPAPFLIDGDTGQLLASADALRGDSLVKTVEQHLSAAR